MSARPGQYVRDHYGVPAFIGRPIVFTCDGRLTGKITGFDGARLLVKFDNGQRGLLHPTWEIEYPLDHDGLPLEANDD